MIRSLALAFAIAPVAIAAPAIAQPGDLERVTAHLQAVDSMTANFVQTDRRGKSLSGTLTLKRPGKIRFQYQRGVPLLLVADGNRLNFIDYQVNQVQSWPIGKSPLAPLLDPRKNLARVAKVVQQPDPRIVVLEARDRSRPEYGVLTLAFVRSPGAPGGLSLQGWVSLDAQNNRTKIQLSNQRFNVPVADNAFRWRDPRRSAGRR